MILINYTHIRLSSPVFVFVSHKLPPPSSKIKLKKVIIQTSRQTHGRHQKKKPPINSLSVTPISACLQSPITLFLLHLACLRGLACSCPMLLIFSSPACSSSFPSSKFASRQFSYSFSLIIPNMLFRMISLTASTMPNSRHRIDFHRIGIT